MSYIYYNPNPLKLSVGDCVIRAISCALNCSWEEAYMAIVDQGFAMYDMPSANRVWSQFLKNNGFKKYQIPDTCPDCYTIQDFCYDHPYGTYIVGTGEHVIWIWKCPAAPTPPARRSWKQSRPEHWMNLIWIKLCCGCCNS